MDFIMAPRFYHAEPARQKEFSDNAETQLRMSALLRGLFLPWQSPLPPKAICKAVCNIPCRKSMPDGVLPGKPVVARLMQHLKMPGLVQAVKRRNLRTLPRGTGHPLHPPFFNRSDNAMTTEPERISQLLAVMTTRDAAGVHFTARFCEEELAALEESGLIEIQRPWDDRMGMPGEEESWTVTVTEAGHSVFDPNAEFTPPGAGADGQGQA